MLIVLVGWALTDLVIEPRLRGTPIDGDPSNLPTQEPLQAKERTGLRIAFLVMLLAISAFAMTLLGDNTPWAASPNADGERLLLTAGAPLMQSIVPLNSLDSCCPASPTGLLPVPSRPIEMSSPA